MELVETISPGRSGTVSAERVMITAVAEDRDPYKTEAELLFRTIIGFGGALARAQKRVCFVESVDDRVRARFNDLGVTVKISDRVNPRCPPANKVGALAVDGECDLLVLLDCDMIVARDFSAHLRADVVQAKPVGNDPLGLPLWERLFAHFGLALPTTRYRLAHHRAEKFSYFNSGVLLIPRPYVDPLAKAWRLYIHDLFDAYRVLPDIAAYRYFTDQIGLTLALAATGSPVQALPLEVNYPANLRFPPPKGQKQWEPYVLHYHHRISPTGRILRCSPFGNINRLIDGVNRYLATSETSPQLIPSRLSKATPWIHHLRKTLNRSLRHRRLIQSLRRWALRRAASRS